MNTEHYPNKTFSENEKSLEMQTKCRKHVREIDNYIHEDQKFESK